MPMDMKSTSKRVLRAAVLSVLAGGMSYGLTVWLAPSTVSAQWVAVVVAIITGLAVLAPAAVLSAIGRSTHGQRSQPETYYDLDFSLDKYRRTQDD